MTADKKALLEWLRRNWRQDDPKRTKYLASMSYGGGRIVRWLVVKLMLVSTAFGGPFLVTAPDKFVANICIPTGPGVSPAVLPATARIAPSRVGPVHSHRCAACGNVWSHTDASFGDRKAHTCGRCGRVEWNVSSQVIQKQPAALSNSSCPLGGCPTSGRRGKR